MGKIALIIIINSVLLFLLLSSPLITLATSLIPVTSLAGPDTFSVSELDRLIILFEKDGQAYNKPIKFEISCYGRDSLNVQPTTNYRQKVSTLSGDCKSYGCEFPFIGPTFPDSLKTWEIKSCLLKGTTQGIDFEIDNPFELSEGPLLCTASVPSSCRMIVDLTNYLHSSKNFLESFSQDGIIGVDELLFLLTNWGMKLF